MEDCAVKNTNTADEIFRRIRVVKERRMMQRLSAVTGVLVCTLVVLICNLPASPGVKADYTNYGAFLLGPETGGYVLVAVLAFLAGILVSFLAQKYRKSRSDTQT